MTKTIEPTISQQLADVFDGVEPTDAAVQCLRDLYEMLGGSSHSPEEIQAHFEKRLASR